MYNQIQYSIIYFYNIYAIDEPNLTRSCDIIISNRFPLFWVFGEARVKESLSSVSLSLPRWESSRFHPYTNLELCPIFLSILIFI